ncbi:MAG TPA: electron transfer flavoprotein subunit alpha/FixB family protein, partial [Gammaproteobacteria bacterium]
MASLVLAEHDNTTLKPATLHAVTAAVQCGGPVTVLVAGSGCAGVAQQAAQVAGVDKVLLVDDAHYLHPLAEPVADLLLSLADGYSHLLAPATTSGKNLLPRVAALKDVAMISEIVAVDGGDTFVRPIYAGNALATVKSSDA